MSKAFDITFLGTCACDFSPRLKGELRDCFDKDARRSSAVLINKRFLIDCGTHTLDSLRIAGADTDLITDIFITHLHSDHFNADNIAAIARGHKSPLRLWVRADAMLDDIENVQRIRMESFKKYSVTEGLELTAIPANHAPSAYPQHFILESCGKKMFYGCDGGWFLNESFIYLKRASLDLAVLDCTVGDYVGDFRMGEHNSIPMIRLMLPSLLNVGAIREDTEIYLSHLAPSLHEPHEITVRIAEDFGAKVAYDGLTIEI